jgi:death-on-curing family protein
MPKKSTKRVTLAHVEYVAHRLATELMEWDEPIPSFNTRYPDKLESCVETPFQTYDKKSLYKGLIGKAAILFYLMVKNHPFQNGNKRIAIMTLLDFLYLNDYWLSIDSQELYNFAKWVASSNPKVKDETLAAVTRFIKEAIVKNTPNS